MFRTDDDDEKHSEQSLPNEGDAYERDVLNKKPQKVWHLTLAYLVATALRKFGAAIWIPVLLVLVDPEDFTRYGLMLSLVNLLVPLLAIGLPFAPMRLAYDYADDSTRQTLYREVVFATWIATLIGLLCLGVFSLVVYPYDPLSEGSLPLKLAIALQTAGMIFSEIAFSILRVQGNGYRYAISSMVYAFGPFAVAMPFLICTNADPLFVISIAMGLGSLGAGAMAIGRQSIAILRAQSNHAIRESAIRFSLPVMVHLVGLWGINASGRWIGTFSQSLAEMAPFNLLSAISALAMGVPVAILEARLPKYNTAFGLGDLDKATGILRRLMLFASFCILIIYFCCAIGLWGASSYLASYQPTPLMFVGFCLFNLIHCFYLVGVNTLHGIKQTRQLAFSTLLSGGVTIAISYFASLNFGQPGLLLGMVLGMALQAIGMNLFANVSLRKLRVVDQGRKAIE